MYRNSMVYTKILLASFLLHCSHNLALPRVFDVLPKTSGLPGTEARAGLQIVRVGRQAQQAGPLYAAFAGEGCNAGSVPLQLAL